MVEAITSELLEWLRFVQRRLGLYRHITYISRRLLFMTVGTLEGMVFNWTAFVVTCIHAKMETKQKLGKFTSLLYSNYIHFAIAYALSQAPSIPRKNIPLPVPQRCKRNVLALIANSGDVVHKIRESNCTLEWEAIPKVALERISIYSAVNVENEVSISLNIDRLAFPHGRLPEDLHLKNAILKHVFQLHCMIRTLYVEGQVRHELEGSRTVISEESHRIMEQERIIQKNTESKLLLKREFGEKQEAWKKEKECIQRIMKGHGQDLIQLHNILIMEREKTKCQLKIE